MSRFVLRLALFAMAFQLEVRVNASIQDSQDTVALVQGATARVQLLPSTLFEKKSPEIGRLVQGTLRAVCNDAWTLQTVFGEATLTEGEFWALTRSGEILFRAVRGDLRLRLRDGGSLDLPEGFQAWIGGIGADGKSLHGVPEPIPVREHLALWSRVHDGDKESFRKDVLALKERWKTQTERAAQLYEKVVLRHVASAEAREAEELRARRERQRRQNEIRDLYRRKLFER